MCQSVLRFTLIFLKLYLMGLFEEFYYFEPNLEILCNLCSSFGVNLLLDLMGSLSTDIAHNKINLMSGFGMYTLHSKKGVAIFDNV